MSVPAETARRQVLAEGRATYPELAASDPAIEAALGGLATDVPCAADLYLATAAGLGAEPALRQLERLLATVKPALRGIVLDHEADEVIQELRVKLLVGGAGKPPTITTYAGKGALRAWMRVAVLRAGLDRRRRAAADVRLDETAWLALATSSDDPTLAAMRGSLGPVVRAAIEAAMQRLDARDRLILRQHLVDGLPAPDLAALHGVHRVTAFRWLVTIRQRLLADVRAALARELALGGDSIDSLMRELRSNVAPTVERMLLASEAAEPPPRDP
ncbi:MAG: hypothetical protein M3680_29895 [Myxococcota bacterium]|nr:hypothetical protein [Myxococcota bacterium]